jgi:hypothetical protein
MTFSANLHYSQTIVPAELAFTLPWKLFPVGSWLVLEHVQVIGRHVHDEAQYADKLFSCAFAFFPNLLILFTSSSVYLWS